MNTGSKPSRHLADVAHLPARFNWTSSDEGATSVEYAMMLALVVAALVAGSVIVGDSARDSFQLVTGAIHNPQQQRPETKTSPAAPAERTPSGDRGGRVVLSNWRLAGVLISLLLNCVLWYLLYRRRHSQLDALQEQRHAQVDTLSQESLFQLRQQMLKSLSNHIQSVLNGQLLVRHMLVTDPCILRPADPVELVLERMRERRLRHVLVCDAKKQLLGVVSRTDLIGQQGRTAGQVMTSNPLTVGPDAFLNAAITLLLSEGVSCLPVINEDRVPLGVLSIFDLVLGLQCTLMTLQTMSAQHEIRTTATRPRTISDIVHQLEYTQPTPNAEAV